MLGVLHRIWHHHGWLGGEKIASLYFCSLHVLVLHSPFLLFTGYQEARCNTQDLSCASIVLQALASNHTESFDNAT